MWHTSHDTLKICSSRYKASVRDNERQTEASLININLYGLTVVLITDVLCITIWSTFQGVDKKMCPLDVRASAVTVQSKRKATQIKLSPSEMTPSERRSLCGPAPLRCESGLVQ